MKKFIYLVHVDCYTGYFNPFNWDIGYAPNTERVEFIQNVVKKFYPEYQIHCVRDFGVEEVVLKKIKHDKDVHNLSILKDKNR